MRKLTNEEISKRVRFSLCEEKYLVFAEDGATVIGKTFIKEAGIALLKAYHAARAVLARKGKASEHNFRSHIYGDIPLVPSGLSGSQRKAMDHTQEGRKRAEFTEGGIIVKPPKDYSTH